MLKKYFERLESLHDRLKREASGINIKYCILLGIRILYALLGKGIVYKCFNVIRYFIKEDLLIWYLFYWVLFSGVQLKTWFSRIILLKNRFSQ